MGIPLQNHSNYKYRRKIIKNVGFESIKQNKIKLKSKKSYLIKNQFSRQREKERADPVVPLTFPLISSIFLLSYHSVAFCSLFPSLFPHPIASFVFLLSLSSLIPSLCSSSFSRISSALFIV